MSEINITVTKKGFKCERCGHQWFPRANEKKGVPLKLPVVCPNCCSPYWNTPRKNKNKTKKK